MECHAGYTKYEYEAITVNNRNSISEYRQDLNVRNQLWTIGVGDYVLDVGSGFGSYTLMALAMAAGFVFAFERDPNILKALRTNIQNNRHIFATEKTSICRWNLNDSTNTIDRFLSELSFTNKRVDWIKIHMDSVADSRLVLWGCKDTIKTFKPIILIADPEPQPYSFMNDYVIKKIVDGHSLLMEKNLNLGIA